MSQGFSLNTGFTASTLSIAGKRSNPKMEGNTWHTKHNVLVDVLFLADYVTLPVHVHGFPMELCGLESLP